MFCQAGAAFAQHLIRTGIAGICHGINVIRLKNIKPYQGAAGGLECIYPFFLLGSRRFGGLLFLWIRLILFFFRTTVTFSGVSRYTIAMGTIKFLFLVLLTQLLSVWFDMDKEQEKDPAALRKETPAPAQAVKPGIISWQTIVECIRQEHFFF